MIQLHHMILGATVSTILAAASGYFYGKGQKELIEQERIVYKQAETVTVFRDRIVTVTKEVKPDGTITETTKNEESDKSVTEELTESDIDHIVQTRPVLASYSLGLHAVSNLRSVGTTRPQIGISVGSRTVGPFWTVLQVVPQSGAVSLGISIEF